MHFNFGVYFRSKLDTWKILFGFKSYGQQKNVSKLLRIHFFILFIIYIYTYIYIYIYTHYHSPPNSNKLLLNSLWLGWAGFEIRT